MQYEFIEQERATFSRRRRGAVLGVAASGYSDERNRQPRRRAQAHGELSQHIQQFQQRSRGT